MGHYEAFGRAVDRCESFLERRFLVALLFSETFSFAPVEDPCIAEDGNGVILGQQIVVSPYRLDFGLKRRGWDGRVGIELDGHQFHASPEAAVRDRARDRDLTARGWRVLRFSSREIQVDALACAREAYGVVMTLSKLEKTFPFVSKARPQQLTLQTGT